MIITNREFVRDVQGATAFTKTDFAVNPGLNITFPWLSGLAASYDEYVPKAIVFEFKSTCSDSVVAASTSLSMGSVMMAANYNPTREVFFDKRTMENTEGCVSGKPSASKVLVVDVKKASTVAGNRRYVRTGPVLETEDLRLYDPVTLSVAVANIPGDVGVIGELWVSYVYEFFKPRYAGVGGASVQTDHYVIQPANVGGTFNEVGPFGSGLNQAIQRPPKLNRIGTWLSCSIPTHGLDLINFPKECQGNTYMILVVFSGDQPAVPNGSIAQISDSHCTNLNMLKNQSVSYLRTIGGTTATMWFTEIIRVDFHDQGPWWLGFELSDDTSPGNPSLDIYVMQISGLPDTSPL